MSDEVSGNDQTAAQKIRNSALRHALSIEDKKRMRARVADLIVEAYDLPSNTNADPAHPTPEDLAIFMNCLKYFQPSDLDDLVQERNIDRRCGYALCPNPNRNIPGGGEKVWNQKGGKDFKLLSKAEIEKWCSDLCGNRSAFVRGQLSSEPSWLRESQNEVKLLDRIQNVDDELAGATKNLSLEGPSVGDVAGKLDQLSMERGESKAREAFDDIAVVEKENISRLSQPPNSRGHNEIEGFQPRKVRFAEQGSAL